MAGPAVWIDITAADAPASRAFYARLFGWEIDVVEELDYGLLRPGRPWRAASVRPATRARTRPASSPTCRSTTWPRR
jgi:hypothetical protein